MFIIIGTHFFVWGAQMSPFPYRCGQCGHIGNFVLKSGMRFLTLFFIIPVIPLSGIKQIAQCPSCNARYQAAVQAVAA